MDREKQKITQPYYKKIYSDILIRKFPEKIDDCQSILSKGELNVLDIIQLNQRIFGCHEVSSDNQKLRSYDDYSIVKILEYQKKHNLNNTQLSLHFKLSRNTITKWKNNYEV
ncbi:transposase [Chryseobacterium viscerum]|uniref:Helix-turn-helix domain-containing protein n=1 Tax=Chryseobacterium viscerum TaxID=1037377 RepID=A0A316WHQ6_9FLAO|nr:transposase [Chryseobacterium viscerum]KAB1231619.1 helix-turn-helix domain-containing protein [Chryseobacterium viscerum]PWN60904.1 transposase [Chryseobacterium viscerum]